MKRWVNRAISMIGMVTTVAAATVPVQAVGDLLGVLTEACDRVHRAEIRYPGH